MELELLNCSICPKQPSFSDTSHLLTHVSSKGHLSHLHKLQVRSHQEIAAGVQLATYNQWYQQHALGQLLSERMIMKEAKKAGRRKNATRRGAYVTQPSPIANAVTEQALPPKKTAKGRKQSQRKQARGRKSRHAFDVVVDDDDDDSDFDFSPVKRSRPRPRQPPVVSPVRAPPSPDGHLASEDDEEARDGSHLVVTPEHSKLKGTVWPGMDLFDAASDEMKRRRNQKKDGSVLRRMERLSALVEPREVVYSPGGRLKKARHIDDLEDASSLIDGESPLLKMKQVRPRKRQPLADRDTNAPRLVKRKAKGDPAKKQTELPFMHGLPPLPHLPSSSIGDFYTLGSRFLVTEEEDDDFKAAAGDLSARKRSAHFTIFNDGSPGYTASTLMEERQPHHHSSHQAYTRSARTSLPVVSTPWLQPQYQSAWQYANPYPSFRPEDCDYHGVYDAIDVTDTKEDLPSLPEPSLELREPSTNPLAWRSPDRDVTAPVLPSDSPFTSFFGLFPGGMPCDDPFVTAKNPLVAALEHLGGETRVTPKSPAGPASNVIGSAEHHTRALSAPVT